SSPWQYAEHSRHSFCRSALGKSLASPYINDVVSILGGGAIKLSHLLESLMRPAPDPSYSCTVARRTTCSEGNFVCESVSAVTKTLKVWKVVAVFRSPL